MNTEFDIYKDKIKNNIKKFIENNMLSEAKELLIQYENIVNDDTDVYSIKGIIEMIQGDFSKAKNYLEKGLRVNPDNFDLLYNMGYLSQIGGDNTSAIKFYKKAKSNAVNDNDVKQINSILSELEDQCDNQTGLNKTNNSIIDKIEKFDEQLRAKYNL